MKLINKIAKTVYLNDQELETLTTALCHYEQDCVGDDLVDENILFDIEKLKRKLVRNKIKRM